MRRARRCGFVVRQRPALRADPGRPVHEFTHRAGRRQMWNQASAPITTPRPPRPKVAHSSQRRLVSSAIAALIEEVTATPALSLTKVSDERLARRRMEDGFDAAMDALQQSKRALGADILAAAAQIGRCLERGGKVLVCGNGGSAADSQHFAAELVGKFRSRHRAGLPVIALTADTALLTAWANDEGYDVIFARQVRTFGQPGDVLLVMSTSGRSPNVVKAVQAATANNLFSLALLGGDGGSVRGLADQAICVPATDPQRIQEIHLLVLHLICEWIEEDLLRVSGAPAPETTWENRPTVSIPPVIRTRSPVRPQRDTPIPVGHVDSERLGEFCG